MRSLLFFLALTGAALFSQGSQPDCVLDFKLTAAGNSSTFDNRSSYCSTWVLAYSSVGFTGSLALTVQSAPVASGGVPGSWATYGGTVSSGINPNTVVTQAQTKLEGFYPFMRVNLASLTGSGTVEGRLYGFRYHASRVVESSGGGLSTVATTDITSGSAHGNGTKFQLFTGTSATNDCAKFDSNGNVVSAGAACASGGTTVTVAPPFITVGGTTYAGQVFAITDPAATTFSWINQGSSTLTTRNGAPTLCSPSSGGLVKLAMRTIAAPTPPWTITALLDVFASAVSYTRAGMIVYESGTGKSVSLAATVGQTFNIDNWSALDNYASSPAAVAWGRATGLFWYRITDTGTNLDYSVSQNGQDWYLIYSASRTNYLTTGPTNVGFFANPNAAVPVCVTLLSWQQT